jgi:two-component system chemotaxis sensor kinase CheA
MDRDLQLTRHTAERLRLTRSGVLFDLLERTARDAAQALEKQILFEGRGGEVRLDAHVLDVVQSALVQLVRNAVAHGIEPEARRSAVGKPPAGRIVLKVARRGRRIAFSCSDDGAGVDVEAVRLTALRKGLANPAIGGLGAEDILRLLLGGGISTAGTVTEVSGRGIGLDIVREAGERLGGEVAVRTQAGVGTTVELLIPISVASLEVLLIGTPDGVMSVPLDAVRRIQHLRADDIARTAQGQTAACDGETLPFAPLSTLIGARSAPRRGGAWTAVVVVGAHGEVALGVDRLLGSTSVVLRPLPQLAPPVPIVAGTSSDADGAPQLVLDPDGLVAAVQKLTALPEGTEEAPRSLLVIDDSLTTRMLEKSILESAGYRVNTATSAEEGLVEARREPYALFLVDVEMPGMDGFTFIEQVRRDPELRDVPALLVTSRGSPASRQRGRDVGAQGYIIKSEFDQRAFLQAVGQLVN